MRAVPVPPAIEFRGNAGCTRAFGMGCRVRHPCGILTSRAEVVIAYGSPECTDHAVFIVTKTRLGATRLFGSIRLIGLLAAGSSSGSFGSGQCALGFRHNRSYLVLHLSDTTQVSRPPKIRFRLARFSPHHGIYRVESALRVSVFSVPHASHHQEHFQIEPISSKNFQLK